MSKDHVNELRRRLMLGALLVPATTPMLALGGDQASAVSLENSNLGTTGWQINKWTTYFDWAFDTLGVDPYPEIEGYASAQSANLGESISLYVNCSEPTFTVRVFRLGWYAGVGARLMYTTVLNGQQQVLPTHDALGAVDCNWIESTKINIPNSWTSGIYVVKLTANVSGAESFITFVVRDDGSKADHVFQSALNTSQAYNNWGGKSLYEFNSKAGQKARAVCFNRPDIDGGGAGQLFHWELSMVRFLEKEGYDVTYIANADVHTNAALLTKHKSFLSVGHDEYWSYQQKKAVMDAQAAGLHCGFFSANAAYWQVRFSSDLEGRPNRVMTSYKELAGQEDPFALDADQTNNKYITTQWRNLLSFGVTDPVAKAENSMIGVMYHTDPVNSDVIVYDPKHWVFANTGVVKGTVFPGLLGYETDSMFDNGNQPAGIRKLCESPDKAGFSHSTIFVAPSGATTFGAGTMQWSWGLAYFPSWAPNSGTNRENAAVQQATRNILNRFELPALVAPTNVKTIAGNKQVILSWNKVTGAATYDVYRSLTPGGEGEAPYRPGCVSTAIVDGNVVNGTKFYYTVVARVGAGESLPSAEVSALPVIGVLIAQSITFVAISPKKVSDPPYTLSATASSSLPVTYTSLTPTIATVSGNKVTFIGAGTATIAANQAGDAKYSPAPQVTQSIIVTGGVQTVQPPTGLTGYSCDVGCWAAAQGLGIRVNWTQSPSPNIASNTVWRGDGTTGALIAVATIPAGTFYLDKNVVKGHTYHYRISATNNTGMTSVQGNDTALAF